MSEAVAAHRRQFVVGPQAVDPTADWCRLRLDEHHWLSYCPRLPVTRAIDGDGAAWVLLGLAEQSIGDEPDPEQAIARCATAGVIRMTDSWAGRWVLIGDGKLTMDASGFFGCFFRVLRSGVLAVSSSEALLPRDSDQAPSLNPRKLTYERRIAFFPPPTARQQGVARLLPSQILDMRTGETPPQGLLPKLPDAPDQHALGESIIAALGEPIRRIEPRADPLWVSLSAGGDSRLVLAAALRVGVVPRTFTRVTRRMSAADFFLPPRIAARFSLEHQYLDEGMLVPGRWDLVQTHSAGNVSHGDAVPMLRGGRDQLKGISIGGHGFGLAKKTKRDGTVGADPNDPLARASEFAAYVGEPEDSNVIPALARWVAWARDNPCPGLDLRDRYYLEQVCAGWQSSKEQVYDMGLHQRFFPLNCRRTHALLFEYTRGHEPGIGFETALVQQACPELLEWPFNPPDASFGRWQTLVARSKRDPRFPLQMLAALSESLLERLRLRLSGT